MTSSVVARGAYLRNQGKILASNRSTLVREDPKEFLHGRFSWEKKTCSIMFSSGREDMRLGVDILRENLTWDSNKSPPPAGKTELLLHNY
jgi:hypothetical protein